MNRAKPFLQGLDLPTSDSFTLPSSNQHYKDGGNYRVEIPSVEGPATMDVVIKEAKRYTIKINRVSQGSGMMLLRDEEIRDMVQMGNDEAIEVCLFVGPRMSFDISAGAFSDSGGILGWRHAGMDQLAYALEDVFRATDLGVRSILVADEGLLWLINQAKKKQELPNDLVIKVSALMSPPNPVTAKIMAELGGTTLNIPGDLSLPKIAAYRQVIDNPIDLYIESPDNLGGFLRYYDIPEIVRIASPVFLKFGLRNASTIYPSGRHLEKVSMETAAEKVHRASIGLELLKRYSEAIQSTSLSY